MDNVENVIIEHLKNLRSELAGMRAEVHAEFKDVKLRLNHLETSIAGVRRDGALVAEDSARQQLSIDQIVERIHKIERRLELSN